MELPDLRPASDEVLVHVEACGVCHSDLHLADGEWGESLARRVRPTILGHEIVGTVVARGADVRSIEKGERIGVGWVGATCGGCAHCKAGDDNLCDDRRITGIDRPGGYASLATIKATQAVNVPDSLPPAEAAPLFCAGVTVYRGMKKASIEARQHVAVFGVGGLGHIAVQLARMWRAETFAIDVDETKLAFARDHGARHVVLAGAAESELRAAGGVDVAVVTAASGRAYVSALASLRKRGTLVVVGLPNEPLQLVADDIATREIRIVGSAVGSREDLREILDLAARGRIRCVTETTPLANANEALARLRSGDVRGRLVLVP